MMDRYYCGSGSGYNSGGEMKPDSTGEWVAYDDHCAALAAETARADGLEAEIKLVRALNEALRQRDAELTARAEKAEAERDEAREDRGCAQMAKDWMEQERETAIAAQRELVEALEHLPRGSHHWHPSIACGIAGCELCEWDAKRNALLEKHGRVRILYDDGVTVRAEWCENATDAKKA